MTESVAEEYLELDLSIVCRICLNNKGTVPIFSDKKTEDDFTLQERIMSFAYVEIFEGDGLPSQICKRCLVQINRAFKLKAQCEYSDYFLRQHCITSKDEGTEDVEEELLGDGDIEAEESAEEVLADGVVQELLREHVIEGVSRESSEPSDKDIYPSTQVLNNSQESTSIASAFRVILSPEKITHASTSNACIDSSVSIEPVAESIKLSESNDNNETSHILINDQIPIIIIDPNDGNGQGLLINKNSNPVKRKSPRLRKRDRITMETGVHTCTICGDVFAHAGSLKHHVLKVHKPSGEFPCTECGQNFPHELLLDIHVKSHTAERPHCCTYCGKCFMQLGTLISHERVHKKAGFLCSHCGKMLKSRKGHTCRSVSASKEKTYQCNVCGKKFMTETTLNTHKKRHRQVEKFRCKTCMKPFFSGQELLRHTRVHLNVRPYACNFFECNHTFYTKGELNRHTRYHRGEKRFKCDQCDCAFYESGHLVNHKRKHTGERPYICDVCPKSFTDASKLKRHLKIHYGPTSRQISREPHRSSSSTDHVACSPSKEREWAVIDGETIQLQCDMDSDD